MKAGRFFLAACLSFFAYSASASVLPVALVALSADLGFDLEEGGLTAGGALQAGRTVSIVLAMVFCGFAAGRWGKRRTLGVALLLLASSLALCSMTPSYMFLFAALLLVGLGEGVVEGLGTPFVHDLYPGESGRYLNISHSFWSTGMFFTVIVSGALLACGVSWRLLVGGVAVIGLVPAALLLLASRGATALNGNAQPLHWSVVAGQTACIIRRPRFWLFFAAMFVAGGGEYCLTYWSASYIQMEMHGSAFSGGIGLACFSAGMMAGRLAWGCLIRQHRLRGLILSSSLAGTLIACLIPVVDNLYLFLILVFLAGFSVAPFWPSIQGYAADRLPGADTTMLFILLSCSGVPGCGFFTWLMGFIGNMGGGLRQAFWVVPSCFVMLAVLMWMDRLDTRSIRSRSVMQGKS